MSKLYEKLKSKMSLSEEIVRPSRPYFFEKGRNLTGVKIPITAVEALFHGLNGYMGLGVLMFGRALHSSGIIPGILLLFIIAGVNLHCQHILLKASNILAEKEHKLVTVSYSETIQYTLADSESNWFKQRSGEFGILSTLLLFCAIIKITLEYLKVSAENFLAVSFVSSVINKNSTMLLILLPIMWLLCFIKNLRTMTFMMVVIIGIKFTIYGLSAYSLYENFTSMKEIRLAANPLDWSRYFQIIFFGFEGILLLLPIQREMKNPSNMNSRYGVLNMLILTVTLLNLVFGSVAYVAKGEHVTDLHVGTRFDDYMKCLVGTALMMCVPFYIYIANEIFFPRINDSCGPYRRTKCANFLFKTVFLIIIYAIANLRAISTVISLIGPITYSLLGLFLPAILDLILKKGNYAFLIINVVIIVMSILICIMGTLVSFTDIMKSYDEE